MKAIKTLYANDGMILTDGEHFGRIIHLAIGADTSAYYETTLEEYERILAEQAVSELAE